MSLRINNNGGLFPDDKSVKKQPTVVENFDFAKELRKFKPITPDSGFDRDYLDSNYEVKDGKIIIKDKAQMGGPKTITPDSGFDRDYLDSNYEVKDGKIIIKDKEQMEGPKTFL